MHVHTEWRHTYGITISKFQCRGNRPAYMASLCSLQWELLYSPDTDIYHIGLAIIQENSTSEVFVELKGHKNESHRYLNLNRLIKGLHSHPYPTCPCPICSESVCDSGSPTGCDYISYFKGLGKAFLSMFSFNTLNS